MKASERARLAWRAFSVQALVLLGTQDAWYPVVAETAAAAFGDQGRTVVTVAVAVAGVLGWIKPQASLYGRK